MTTPADIRRLIARITNSANTADARLDHATQALQLHAADGHKPTASGNYTGTPGGEAELWPTETAAMTNLGDLQTWPCNGTPCTEPTHRDPDTGQHDNTYRPGPITRLADLESDLRAALTAMDRAHNTLGDCGIPPLLTRGLQCRGINGAGCTDWADQNREDHLCIDCGRTVDRNRRATRAHNARLRRHSA